MFHVPDTFNIHTQVSSIAGGNDIFLYSTAPRPTLGPILHSVPWIEWAVSLGNKRPRREAEQSAQCSVVVKNEV
jgi:hypothetical protein